MSKPKGSKYALFPNLWEFLNLIATVLGLGTKATVWGNNKTFYKCEAKYDELFQSTLFLSSDYQNLITKDLKSWTKQDKALAFSIPFSGLSQNEKYRLYSEVFDRIVSNRDRFAHNGSTHPNMWIDQFTEQGYSFGWMEDKQLDDTAKQVLRKEKSKKENFEKLQSLVINSETSELVDAVKEEFGSDLEKNRESIAGTVLVKGSGRQINHVLSELSHQIPKDAIHQIRSGFVIKEILRELNVLSSDSYESHLMWRATSKYYPFLGSTGYLCKQRLLLYIPRIKNFIQKHPKMIELLLMMIVSIYSIKNKFNFKKLQQEKAA